MHKMENIKVYEQGNFEQGHIKKSWKLLVLFIILGIATTTAAAQFGVQDIFSDSGIKGTGETGQAGQASKTELEDGPWKNAEVIIYLSIPQSIIYAQYHQRIETIKISYNIPPSGIADAYDNFPNENKYKVVYWNETQNDEIIVSAESVISRKIWKTSFLIAEPWPIVFNDFVYENIKTYLYSSAFAQSDNEQIIKLAEELSKGCDKQEQVLDNTFKWIYENIQRNDVKSR